MSGSLEIRIYVTVDEARRILRVFGPSRDADGTGYPLSKLEKAADRTATAIEWRFGGNMRQAIERERSALPWLFNRTRKAFWSRTDEPVATGNGAIESE